MHEEKLTSRRTPADRPSVLGSGVFLGDILFQMFSWKTRLERVSQHEHPVGSHLFRLVKRAYNRTYLLASRTPKRQ